MRVRKASQCSPATEEGQQSGSATPQGDLLVLGQTLTTDTGGMGRGGGSHALG
ncbi:MAG: hypothetical protein ABJF10_25060 [Chthoniobacter sp.]|uniref:hypothetical protein n=1 Tax=Chthoniobacter sp. TaxID=2510640 RepID=UPI0032AC5E7F